MTFRLLVLAAMLALVGCASNESIGTVVGEASAPPTTLTLGRSDDGAPLDGPPDDGSGVVADGEAIIPDPGIVETDPMDPADIGPAWELAFSNVESLDPAAFDATNDCQIETPEKIDGEVHLFSGPEEDGFLELIFEGPESDLSEWVDVYRQLAACDQMETEELIYVATGLEVTIDVTADEWVAFDLTVEEVGGEPVDASLLVMARYGDVILVGISPEGAADVDVNEIARRLGAAAESGGLS